MHIQEKKIYEMHVCANINSMEFSYKEKNILCSEPMSKQAFYGMCP